MTRASDDAEKLEPSYIPVRMENDAVPMKNNLSVPTIQSAILLLRIYLGELETYTHKRTGTQMFTAALCTTAKSENSNWQSAMKG
jgi:hypothetical protein